MSNICFSYSLVDSQYKTPHISRVIYIALTYLVEVIYDKLNIKKNPHKVRAIGHIKWFQFYITACNMSRSSLVTCGGPGAQSLSLSRETCYCQGIPSKYVMCNPDMACMLVLEYTHEICHMLYRNGLHANGILCLRAMFQLFIFGISAEGTYIHLRFRFRFKNQ